MKRFLSCLLALVLLLSALPFAGAEFTDNLLIKDDFKKAVSEMSEKKILGGFPDGSFAPTKTLTRAQAAKILCVMLEGEEKANALTKLDTGFADVPASHWAAKYVAYCVDRGVVAGVGDGKFAPDAELSSGAFAKMLLVAYGADASKFTGADWLKNVQTAAESTFYLYQFDKGVTADPMQRQQAAQMAFNACFQAEATADKAKGDPRPFSAHVPERMKLLVIGNSYGNDCSLQYLFQELQSVGVKDLTIGVLYYSGCPYRKHIDFALQDKGVYKYHKTSTGKFKTTFKTTFDKVISDEKWDNILMLSGWLGHPRDFTPAPWQDLMLCYVRRICPDAVYGYDMTWAMQDKAKATEVYATLYDRSQQKMFDTIIETTKTYVVPEQRYKYITPVGTAVQNARTSFLGDRLNRDGDHLNKGIGRYIASMTVCCKLTGVTPDQIPYVPDTLVQDKKDYKIADLDMTTPGLAETLDKIARESVKNALEKPFEVTQSAFTTAP